MKAKILIVEDEETSIRILKKFLEQYQLTFCCSEKDMLEKLSEDKYDLILMDLGLPGLKNGLEITTGLKANKKYSEIPIICITSYVYDEQEIKAFKSGADGYLTKPFSKPYLLETIEKHLNRIE